jgi:hypothetical protein
MELESTIEWLASITTDEIRMGYQDNPPIDQHEDFQRSRLHKVNQSMKQLEEFVE